MFRLESDVMDIASIAHSLLRLAQELDEQNYVQDATALDDVAFQLSSVDPIVLELAAAYDVPVSRAEELWDMSNKDRGSFEAALIDESRGEPSFELPPME